MILIGKNLKNLPELKKGTLPNFTNNTLNNNDGSIIDMVFRRCLFLDNYSAGASHSQGFWASGTEITLEECIFDHNGWYSQNDSGLAGLPTSP